MLQRALATLLCLLGAASIGLGAASATLWRASDTLVASAESSQGSTLLLTDPGVLDMAAESVTIHATAASGDKVVLALGRTADVEAWVGTDAHTTATGLLDRTTLSTTDAAAVPPAQDPAATAPATDPATAPADPATAPADPATDPAADPAAEDPAATAPDPAGSDLWVAQASGTHDATLEWTREDGRWSVLAATVGADAGPVTLTLTWPQVVTTPWLVPGAAGGSVLLLAGLVWWALILLRGRRQARVTMPASTGAVPVTGPVPVGARSGATAGSPAGVPAGRPTVGPQRVTGALDSRGAPVENDERTRPLAPVDARSAGGGSAAAAQPPGASADATPVPVAIIDGPLTRRQIRERDQLLALEREREREEARSGFPRLLKPRADTGSPAVPATEPGPGSPAVPATPHAAGVPPRTAGATPDSPQRPSRHGGAPAADAPAVSRPGRHGAPAAPAEVGPGLSGPQAPAARAHQSAPPGASSSTPVRPAPTSAPGAQPSPKPTPGVQPPSSASATPPSGATSAEPGAPAGALSRWGRRLAERVPRRGGGEQVPQVPPHAGQTTPSGQPSSPHVTISTGVPGAPGRPAQAAPSADLWRRAWGFPSEPAQGAAPGTESWTPTDPAASARPDETPDREDRR